MTADERDESGWSAEWEWLPMYRLWAEVPMEYVDYWEHRGDTEAVPDLWRGSDPHDPSHDWTPGRLVWEMPDGDEDRTEEDAA